MEVINRHKRMFLLTGIAMCVLAIIFTINPTAGPTIFARGLSYIVVPMQRGLTSVISWTQSTFAAMANSRQLVSEVQILRETVSRLQLENHRLQLAYEENYRLSAVVNMHQRYATLPTTGARVIGHDPNDWYRSFHIDIGSNDDVAVNMAVLGDGGLLGVVRQVLPGRSQVVSVVDQRFAAAVMSTRTEDIGMIEGDINLMQQGLTRMILREHTAQIMVGDEIVTSPDSSIFAPGMLVGTVVEVGTTPGLTRYAIIEPAANLGNVEMVLVVTEIFGDSQHARDTFLGED